MITIVSGTNRSESECLTFAKKFQDLLAARTDEEVKLLALEAIPHDWFHPLMYEEGAQHASLVQVQDEYLLPAGKFLYVTPEYNGSFPGVLKLLIDACSVRQYKATFDGKKAALVGIASGRAGNLRGMDHLTGILNHVGTIVMPNKLPISRISKLIDPQGEITDPNTLKVMTRHIEDLLAF